MGTLLSSKSRTVAPAPAGGGNKKRQGRAPGLHRVAGSRVTRFGMPALAVLLALVAAAALAFPMLSNWYAGQRQRALAQQLDNPALGATSGSGAALGWITIPAIGLHMVMVEGTDASALAQGPGHYPSTPMPCSAGNVGIAGHRTTFLHPFLLLDRLHAGDVIELRTRTASCTYRVTGPPFVVLPTTATVLSATPGQYLLTLTTCHPRGSSAKRLVVRAAMVPNATAA